jgi:hypothetical protein
MPGDLTQLEAEYRCYRGEHCAERIREAPGVFQPARIHATRGLCVTDTSQLRHAITDLPVVFDDLTDDLGGAVLPGGELVAHTADLQVPINLHTEALLAAIDHELWCWAESVAAQLRVSWDTQAVRASRSAARVRRAARLLSGALPALVSLRDAVHMVWVDAGSYAVADYLKQLLASAGGGTGLCAPGHLATITGPQSIPVERDGLDGALELIALHRRGRHAAGTRGEIYTMPTPCPRCERSALQHRDGSDLVTCAYCRNTWAWDAYQEICQGIITAA